MANSDENKRALGNYTKLVNNHYEEPFGEYFRQYISGIRKGIGVDDDIASTDESDNNEQ